MWGLMWVGRTLIFSWPCNLCPRPRDRSQVDSVDRLYPVVQRGIRGGFFPPNCSHYLCSRKYCGFWRECERQFDGKVGE
jgi:hypothetical protein